MAEKFIQNADKVAGIIAFLFVKVITVFLPSKDFLITNLLVVSVLEFFIFI